MGFELRGFQVLEGGVRDYSAEGCGGAYVGGDLGSSGVFWWEVYLGYCLGGGDTFLCYFVLCFVVFFHCFG